MSNINAFKSFSTNSELMAQVHETITPAEIRQGEKISAKIMWKNGKHIKAEEVRVWRLSPLGVEVTEVPTLKELKIGETLDLEISVGKQMSSLSGQKVTLPYSETGLSLVGIRFCSTNNEDWRGVERRANKRWNCSAEFMPTGVAPNPGRFNDFIFFRVVDVSSLGFRLITSLRNKFLIPGMILDTSVSFPMVGQTRIKAIIRNTKIKNENGKDVLAVGVEYIDQQQVAKEIIGQYVFQFGPAISISEIKSQNLDVIKTSSSVEFRFVRTAKEYNEVLELRRVSYSEAGKLKSGATNNDVADVYDTRSRIVVGLHQGKVVASARLIFNELDDKMEHEQFVSFPQDFPRKDEICEITRVCTHPEYRGSQLLLELFNFVGLTVVQSKRKYILGCGTDNILKLYKNIGFSITDIKYNHKDLNDKVHTVFIGDVVKGLTGVGISPIYWNIVWGNLYQYLNDLSYIDRNPVVVLRVAFYKLFRPISYLLLKLKRKNKKPTL